MGEGTLTIYSASAGSGKTFRLASSYLAALFRSKYQYRRILAVTFTNKATAEMKGRILDQLDRLASGRDSEYLGDLVAATGKSEQDLRAAAKEILSSILHDYSRFSVSTIDAFFQKVIRAFARECGLNSAFSLEIDHSLILTTAVDEMIASTAKDRNLRNWLMRYILSNIDEEKSWNIKDSIIRLSEELFREKFRILSSGEIGNLKDKNFLLRYIEKLSTLRSSFEKRMISFGKKAEQIFSEFGLTDDMFYNKSRGVPGFIRDLSKGRIVRPGEKVRAALGNPPRWATGNPHPHLLSAVTGGLESVLKEAVRLFDETITDYNTAGSILQNFYALGILSDVLAKVHEVVSGENMFLLSDAGELLSLITGNDQTPFIYEKIGSRYENFMIDEFQDTSVLQWNNFRHLIENSMSEGNDNMVVGDVKQSIYRFRNSDWKILGDMLEKKTDNNRIKSIPLGRNYRSRSNIISFNNSFFSVLPVLLDRVFSESPGDTSFVKLYAEAVQSDPGRSTGGYVRIEFIGDDAEGEQMTDTEGRINKDTGKKQGNDWKAKVLKKIPGIIETILDKGYNASDVGILVRDGREGAEVMKTLLGYSGSLQESPGQHRFKVVSNDSLVFSGSNVITFIISALKVIVNPEDQISRALMTRYYLFAKEVPGADRINLFREDLISGSAGYLPDGYELFLEEAGKMTLYDAAEAIIDFFGVGDYSWNVSYLVSFMDIVLEYSRTRNTDFRSFIEWWESGGESKSLSLPSGMDAVRVLTIHKSKGLEFPVVILPFLSWNLDHRPSRRPVIWARPGRPPFNDIGIVPLKYSKDLSETIFNVEYHEERFNSFLDNLNLLYVAMTRAIDALYGFVPLNPVSSGGIASYIREAMQCDLNPAGLSGIVMSKMSDNEGRVFELGEVPLNQEHGREAGRSITLTSYHSGKRPQSLRLKLHAGDYFVTDGERLREMTNYGLIMHEVFAGISCREDIPEAVAGMVLEGKITENEAGALVKRLQDLVSDPAVSSWFDPGNTLMKEAEILLPSGSIKRPDRIILRNGNATIVDFKFGEKDPKHAEQISLYRNLLVMMGYRNTDAYIWYVDANLIEKA